MLQREILAPNSVRVTDGRGVSVYTLLSPGKVLVSQGRFLTVDLCQPIANLIDKTSTGPASITIFSDTTDVRNVEPAFRDAWISWFKAQRKILALPIHVLVQSKILEMSASVMNLSLGGGFIRSYSNPRTFEAAVAQQVPGFRLPRYQTEAHMGL